MATKAFNVTVRRLANGSDYSMRLFAIDAIEAGNRAMERVRFSIGMSRAKYIDLNAKGIAVFRVVSCEVSPDQSRPSDALETAQARVDEANREGRITSLTVELYRQG